MKKEHDLKNIYFDKIIQGRTTYFDESRNKPGHNVNFEQACAIIKNPGGVIPGKKDRLIYAGRLEEGSSPIVAVVSATTSVCHKSGRQLQVGVVFNAYKNSKKKILRLLD